MSTISGSSNVLRNEEKISHVTGVILAGGNSNRMGSNKALLSLDDGRFIDIIYRQVSDLFQKVIISTNDAEPYDSLPCDVVNDIYLGMGPMGGIHAALSAADTSYIFVTACDMPFLNRKLIEFLVSQVEGNQAVIPESSSGLEPLLALYGKSILGEMEICLASGQCKMVSFIHKIGGKIIPSGEVRKFDSSFRSFNNINTPESYYLTRESKEGRESERS